jgi:hypothetical protein
MDSTAGVDHVGTRIFLTPPGLEIWPSLVQLMFIPTALY